jgi:hypothetical protein
MLGRDDGSPPYAHFALFIAEFHAYVHKYNQCQKKLNVGRKRDLQSLGISCMYQLVRQKRPNVDAKET